MTLLTLGLCALVALSFAGCGGGFSSRGATPPGPARMTVRVGVRPSGGHLWNGHVSVRPGSTIEQIVELANVGGQQANDVRVRVGLRGKERPVLASEYTKGMGVSVANESPLRGPLFGRGIDYGSLPGGGTLRVITFDTDVGRRSFSEPIELSWNGGALGRHVDVSVQR